MMTPPNNPPQSASQDVPPGPPPVYDDNSEASEDTLGSVDTLEEHATGAPKGNEQYHFLYVLQVHTIYSVCHPSIVFSIANWNRPRAISQHLGAKTAPVPHSFCFINVTRSREMS